MDSPTKLLRLTRNRVIWLLVALSHSSTCSSLMKASPKILGEHSTPLYA